MEAAPAMNRLAENICKFHQRGHCKFGDSCRKLHTKITCTTPQCGESCGARHPRPCSYFARFGSCKFGTSCSYLHSEHNTNTEITSMKETLQQVINSLQTKEKEIKKLEEKIDLLEKSVDSMVNPKSSETFKCDQCTYTCSSSPALKSHTTKKHKSVKAEEVLPSSLLITQLDGHTDECDEEISFCDAIEEQTFECVFCGHKATSSKTLNGHISLKHTHKCYICNQSFDNPNDFKLHMTDNHSFSEDIDSCYECEDSTEVGRYRALINEEVLMQCMACMMDELSN